MPCKIFIRHIFETVFAIRYRLSLPDHPPRKIETFDVADGNHPPISICVMADAIDRPAFNALPQNPRAVKSTGIGPSSFRAPLCQLWRIYAEQADTFSVNLNRIAINDGSDTRHLVGGVGHRCRQADSREEAS